ncbi:hypothetical protein EYF80_045271 [Liparis tanakae]|uniref:Uncharacterized protein n=1 Tax=Liparis tanakae TaxID=230148 RepID=A0A4Z2FTL7_9TELE|nr:hypothetical protein EYF80_045271 [Liparis tanakae]
MNQIKVKASAGPGPKSRSRPSHVTSDRSAIGRRSEAAMMSLLCLSLKFRHHGSYRPFIRLVFLVHTVCGSHIMSSLCRNEE